MSSANGSSTHELATPATGDLHGPLSGGASKPPRHPWRTKSVDKLRGAASGSKRLAIPTVPDGGDGRETFRCYFCQSFCISQEDLHFHIRRCHVRRSWRRGKDEAPRPPPPSVTERYVFEKRPSLGGPRCSSTHTGKKGLSLPAKQEQEQLADEASPTEAPTTPAFHLNVPAPQVEEEKRSSG